MSHEHLVDAVERDPNLGPAERETGIVLTTDRDRYRITTEVPAHMRHLLQHDHFDLDWVRSPDGRATDDIDDLETVHAVHGTLPIGTLTVKSTTRSTDNLGQVVNS